MVSVAHLTHPLFIAFVCLGLTGNGASVFTDLGFTFTAVDGGKKCTDTKDLAVTVEVLSNEVVATGDDVSCKRRLLHLHIGFFMLLTSLFQILQYIDGHHFRLSC